MKACFHLRPFGLGIAGAILVHSIVQTLSWLFSFGSTLIDYILIWLVLLPIPLTLGVIAGAFAGIVCSTQSSIAPFILGAMGMTGAILSIAFGWNNLVLSSAGDFVAPIFVGVLLELIAMLAMMLKNRQV